jgi:hypothetical protein
MDGQVETVVLLAIDRAYVLINRQINKVANRASSNRFIDSALPLWAHSGGLFRTLTLSPLLVLGFRLLFWASKFTEGLETVISIYTWMTDGTVLNGFLWLITRPLDAQWW